LLAYKAFLSFSPAFFVPVAKMATNLLVATVPWVANEKAAAEAFYVQEKQESGFPVKAQLLWLNEHLSGILKDEARYVLPRQSLKKKKKPL